MGDNEQANIHASNFELATESYIRQQLERLRLDSSVLMTEADLKGQNFPLTPDFVFRDDNIQINGVTVKWIVSNAPFFTSCRVLQCSAGLTVYLL